jgi:hypothetical protein
MISKGLSLRRLNSLNNISQHGNESRGVVNDTSSSKMAWLEATTLDRNFERKHSNTVMMTKDISETTATANAPIKRVPAESFVNLITARNFDRIIEVLSNKRYRKSELFSWVLYDIPRKNMVLHFILPYQPPVEIVHVIATMLLVKAKADIKKIKQKRPNLDFCNELLAIAPAVTVDCAGRVPLHVAVSNGCDVQIIFQLLKAYSDETCTKNTAMCRDYSGRLPLHYACFNLKGIRNFDSSLLSNRECHSVTNKKGGNGWGFVLHGSHSFNTKLQKENTYKVVEALLLAYPEAVMVRDDEGRRPIDIARGNKADALILQLLQDCARRQRRMQDSFYNRCSSRQLSTNPTFNVKEQYNLQNQWMTDTENSDYSVVDLIITVNLDGTDSVSTLGSYCADSSTCTEKQSNKRHDEPTSIVITEESFFSTKDEYVNVVEYNRTDNISGSVCCSTGRSIFSSSTASVPSQSIEVAMTPQSLKSASTRSLPSHSLSSSYNRYLCRHRHHNESSISDAACSSTYQTRLISDTQVEC